MTLDRKKIKKEAKQILDKFAKALAKVDSEKIEFGVDRKDFERKEGEGEICKDFKEKLLGNALNHDDDFIIVERGGWK